jgi:hypothetical protein
MRSPVKRNIGLTNRTAKALAGFFIYHDDNYHARSERDFQVVDFVKTQRAALNRPRRPIYFAQMDRFLRSSRKRANA